MSKSTLIVKKIMISLLAPILIAGPLFIPANADAAPNDPVFVSITSEETTTFALDQDGQIWAWGENSNPYGQYGDGTTVSSVLPKKVQVMNGGTPVRFTKAKPAANHSMALDNNGNIWTTGRDNFGQLGNGPLGDSLTWEKINIPGKTFTDIAATREASFALDSQGILWRWGYDASSNSQVPIQVPVQEDGNTMRLKSLYGHTQAVFATDINDRLWYITEGEVVPERYLFLGSHGFQSVSVGSMGAASFALALDELGDVWGWGNNSNGQLGHGLPAGTWSNPIPISIRNGGVPIKFAQISAGYDHSLGIDVDGKMWVWGANEVGQLGDGTTVNASRHIVSLLSRGALCV